MTQKSVPLSVLIEEAISEANPEPNIQKFTVISNIIQKLEKAGIALRKQCINKMKSYLNKIITEKEMYYMFCLIDHVVHNTPSFRKQVLDIDFIAYIECVGNFKKPILSLSRSKTNVISNTAIMKCRELVQEWGLEFPNELNEYEFLYLKYKQNGIVFPERVKVKTQQQKTVEIPKEMIDLIKQCKQTEKEIQFSVHKSQEIDEMIELYKKATALNCNLMEMQMKVFTKQNSFDSEKVDKINAFINSFQSCLQSLANQINTNQNKIDITISPIDMDCPQMNITKEDPKIAIADKRIGKSLSKPSKRISLIQPPPTSYGLLNSKPIQRTISCYSNEFVEQKTVSCDSFYTTDSIIDSTSEGVVEKTTEFDDCDTNC